MKNQKTHAETVREINTGTAQQQADTYRQMIDSAKQCDERGDCVMARQHRATAENYEDTRMSKHARQIAGLI